MSDKIKQSDIFESGVIDGFQNLEKALQGVLLQLSEIVKAVKLIDSKSILELTKAMADGNQAQAAAIKATNEAEKATKAKSIEELKAAERLRQINQQKRNDIKTQIQLEQAAKGSIAALEAQNKRLAQEVRNVADANGTGKEKIKELNALIDKNNAIIKENSDKLKQQKLNVGNYSESVQDAFKKVGLFGEAFEKLHKAQEIFHSFLKLITIGQHTQTEALKANTAAVESNTVATETQITATETLSGIEQAQNAIIETNTVAHELNTATTESNTIATELNSAAAEANTVALEAEEVATTKLSGAKKILNAITSPTGLIIAGLVATAKVLYDNITATQIAKDKMEAMEESLAKGAKKIDVFGKSALGTAEKVYDLVLAEKALHDEAQANLPVFERMRADAAEARTEAEKENVTTQEKIKLLGDYIDITKDLSKLQRDEKIKEFAKSLGLVTTQVINDEIVATYDLVTAEQVLQRIQKEGRKIKTSDFDKNAPKLREQIDAANQAAQAVVEIDTNLQRELRRATKRQAGLIEQDKKERLALLRESEKRESEMIKDSRERQLKDEKLRYAQEFADTKERQKKLGAIRIDENGNEIDDTKKFQHELETITRLHKFNLAEIERKSNERIQQIRSEIELERLKDNVTDDERLLQEKTKAYEESNNQILNKGKLFNSKLKKEREQNYSNIIALLLQETKDKEDQLRKQAEIEKERIRQTITDKKVQAEELKKIDAKLAIDLGNLQSDEITKEKELARKKLEDDIKIEKERNKKIIGYAQEVTNALNEELQTRNQKKSEALDHQIDLEKTAVDRQFQLASRGLDNQLAFEKEQLAKAELAKKQELERQRKVEEGFKLAQMIMSGVNQKLDKGESFPRALAESVGEAFAVKAIAKSIAGAFFEGSEKIENDLNPSFSTGKDDYLVRVDGKERVMQGHLNALTGGMSNEELARLAFDYNNGRLLPGYALETGLGQGSTAQNMASSYALHLGVKEMVSILKDIKQKPDVSFEFDSMGNFIETRIQNGIKTIINHQQKRARI